MGREEASKKDLANFLGDSYSFLLKKKKNKKTSHHKSPGDMPRRSVSKGELNSITLGNLQ